MNCKSMIIPITIVLLSLPGRTFSGFEHLFIGDQLKYSFPEDNTGLGQQKFAISYYPYSAEVTRIKKELSHVSDISGQYLIIKGRDGKADLRLSPGEIVALAGDYIANPNDSISKPLAPLNEIKSRFLEAYKYLIPSKDNWFWTTILTRADRLSSYRNHLKESFNALFSAIENMNQEYPEPSDQWGKLHHFLVSGQGAINKIVEQAALAYEFYKYKELLNHNIDHFEKDGIQSYVAGHMLAIEKALEAKSLYDRGLQEEGRMKLNEAYTIEAFAHHYLSDAFSAGHILTKRRGLLDLAKNNPEFSSIDVGLMSNAEHDETNWLGLVVDNLVGDRWIAYGDDGYFDRRNAQNALQINKALQASIDELWAAFKSGNAVTPDQFVVEKLRPRALPAYVDITLSDGKKIRQTHNPLFKEKYNEFLIRADVYDYRGKIYKSIQPAFISSLYAWFKSPVDKYSSHDFTTFQSTGLAKKLTMNVEVTCFSKYYGSGLRGILNSGSLLPDTYQAIYIPFSQLKFYSRGGDSITDKTTMYFFDKDTARKIYDQCTTLLGDKVVNIRARAKNLSEIFTVLKQSIRANPNWLPAGVFDQFGVLHRLRGYGEDYFKDYPADNR